MANKAKNIARRRYVRQGLEGGDRAKQFGFKSSLTRLRDRNFVAEASITPKFLPSALTTREIDRRRQAKALRELIQATRIF